MSKRLLQLAATLALVSTTPAAADSAFEAVPTGWILQNYLAGDEVHVYLTPSSCTGGKVVIPATTSNDIKDRFWSLVIAARLSNSVMGIFYNPANCHNTSFYLKG